jgi:hypothetical protein
MLWCTNHPTRLFWLLIWFWNHYMAPQTWPHKCPIFPQNVKSTNCFETSLYSNPYLKSLWSLYNGKTMSNFPKQSFTKATSLLHLVHSDACGPLQTCSFWRSYYFLTFIDDFSHFTKVYLMESKFKVFSTFQIYKTFNEIQIGRKIKVLCFD